MTAAPEPMTPRELRKFALTTGAMFAAIFGLVIPWLFGLRWPVWPWVVGGALVLWGLVHPASLHPVYSVWMRFAEIVGRINNRIVLGAVFFVIITPFGWIRRLVAGDVLGRRFDEGAVTYRKPKSLRPPSSLERPF